MFVANVLVLIFLLKQPTDLMQFFGKICITLKLNFFVVGIKINSIFLYGMK